ncbi:MAG: ATP-dependent DNA helicase, partial [Chrysiogenales bacterium]
MHRDKRMSVKPIPVGINALSQESGIMNRGHGSESAPRRSDEMNEFFGEGGHLSCLIPSFEFRKVQLDMAEFIHDRLYDSGNGIIEAGTGTGKTLAYLIPAVQFAIEQEKKIAISTETKALQKQLVDKDLPIVHRIFSECLGLDFSYSLCLGSSNYPCRKRFESALKTGRFRTGELKQLETIGRLFGDKKIFTHFDLVLPPHLWSEIQREGDSCDYYRCPFSPVCAYQLARREWSRSTVLIMNHYLFFSNIASEKTYLPPFDIVLFDEAHSIEEVAAGQIGFRIGYREIEEILQRFHGDRKNALIRSIQGESIKSRAMDTIHLIERGISMFFEGVRAMVPGERSYIRVKEPMPAGNALVNQLKNLMVVMAEAEEFFGEEHPLRTEFDVARGKLFTYIENLSSFVSRKNDNYVYWIERDTNALLGDLTLRGQPADIAEIFRREIINCYDSSILVSATLAIRDDFSYIIDRLGIEREKCLPLKTHFNYKAQVVLYAAGDLADPSSRGYNEEAAEKAAEIINHLNGNCLMLFTSYKTLREVKDTLAGMISFPIYSQDTMTPTEAYERYVSDEDSVLMGTHSFWQGIDLPGDLVRGVILMKLPFAVPDSPP